MPGEDVGKLGIFMRWLVRMTSRMRMLFVRFVTHKEETVDPFQSKFYEILPNSEKEKSISKACAASIARDLQALAIEMPVPQPVEYLEP